ncbi:hypothetical protein UlMin_040070 [Ulmus minor]
MAGGLKIEIIRRETIKPSSPTPSHLKSFNLSLLDQFSPPIYGPLILFYPKNDVTSDQRSHQLKQSLSKTLTLFYPLAGRLNDKTIECNDEGAQYLEARYNGHLSTLQEQPDPETINRFLPAEILSPTAGTWPLLLIQATFFDCGGLAIGISISHKLADAITISIFFKSWAANSSGHTHQTLVPNLNAASYFPPKDLPFGWDIAELRKAASVNVFRRYVFDASTVAALKTITASSSVQRPTQTEVVTALIWKCVMAAIRINTGSASKRFVLIQAVNLRKRADPPLPENCIGNLVGHFSAQTNNPTPDLQALVSQLRKGLTDYSQSGAKRLGGDEAFNVVMEHFKEFDEFTKRDDIHLMISTSLCNFGFYKVDFGWGKPSWVTSPNVVQNNLITLIETREGGVEAWVCLSKEDMALFERDPELLAFAKTSIPNSAL